jgi:hypothetical protein
VYNEKIIIDKQGSPDAWITIKGEYLNVPNIKSYNSKTIEIKGNARYINIKNLNIRTPPGYASIRLYPGARHIVLENIRCTGGQYGVFLGAKENDIGVRNIYLKNVVVYNVSNRGFYNFARNEYITFNGCVAHDNGDDGFGGHTGTNSDSPVSEDPLDVMNNIFLISCEAYNNLGDGFDFGSVKLNHIFKNCIARNNGPKQGVGFKIWGKSVWLINCISYDNELFGASIKPIWSNTKVYIINSTFKGNNRNKYGGQIRAVQKAGGGYELKNAELFLYNNIFHAIGTTAIQFDHTNITIAEEDYNYYFKRENSIAIDFRRNMSSYESYTFKEIENGTWFNKKLLGQNNFGKTYENDGLSDPGFVDINENILSLRADSLAVDRGIDLGIDVDVLGNERLQGNRTDIGAFEYGDGIPKKPTGLKIVLQ